MSNHPLISLIVLNYNGLKYLKRIIPNLLNLDYPNYEVLVIDNNSSDGSKEWVQNFRKITLIKNPENYGYSKGKNIGAQKANGKYILFLDNDILIQDKNILNKLFKFSKLKKDNCVISVLMVNKGESETKFYGGYCGRYGINERKKVNLQLLLDFSKEIATSCPHGASIFVSKKVWFQLGGYDESQPFNIDDIDIGPRAWIMGIPIYLFHNSFFIHLGIENRVRDRDFCWKYKYFFSGYSRVILKNYKLINIIKVYPLFIFFILLKTIKQFIYRRNLCVIKSLLFSVKIFFKNLPETFNQRKKIQAKRISKKDIFLNIKQPKFDQND